MPPHIHRPAVAANHLGEAPYASTLNTESNSVTPENERKWDATERTRHTFTSGGARRSSPFQDKLGDGFIEEAFRTARAADPAAKLCSGSPSPRGVRPSATGRRPSP